MQPKSGCDEIDLSLEWVHAAQAHWLEKGGSSDGVMQVQQLVREDLIDGSHMRAQVSCEVWVDEGEDYEGDDKLKVQWIDDEEHYLG